MQASRRYEVLSWANGAPDRYIIEDDYDSEFRSEGKPIPTLFSIDGCGKVIYINTFSKSLAPTIRIRYCVMPPHLANRFYEAMSFYSCTVSNFEQYTLAAFIKEGYFEKHINRMRLFYKRKRKKIIDIIIKSRLGEICEIEESDSGLHFLLRVKSGVDGKVIKSELYDRGIKVNSQGDYNFDYRDKTGACFIINYSNLKEETLRDVVKIVEKMM